MTAPMPLEDFTADQASRLAQYKAAQEAPESFDAVAALRRVLDFAARYERGEIGDPGRSVVAWMVQVAIADRTDPAGQS